MIKIFKEIASKIVHLKNSFIKIQYNYFIAFKSMGTGKTSKESPPPLISIKGKQTFGAHVLKSATVGTMVGCLLHLLTTPEFLKNRCEAYAKAGEIITQCGKIIGKNAPFQKIGSFSIPELAKLGLAIGVIFGIISFLWNENVVFIRKNNKKIERAYIDRSLFSVSLHTKVQQLKWQTISMSEQYYNQISSILSIDEFRNMVQEDNLLCPFSQKILKYPYKMKCCKDLTKISAEKQYLLYAIQKWKKCPICGKTNPKQSDLQPDKRKSVIITGLRFTIIKTYKQMNQQNRKAWKKIIDDHFGKNYIQEHIDSWKKQ